MQKKKFKNKRKKKIIFYRIREKEQYYLKHKFKESIEINNILNQKNCIYKRRTLRLSLI